MDYDFNKERLKEELEGLAHFHRIAFAASCCDRMLPNYREFSRVEDWGDFNFLQQVMDGIWSNIIKKHLTDAEIKNFIEKCEEFTPNADDFSSIYVSFAIDAGCSLLNTLNYFLDRDIKRLLFVAVYAISSVDLFVQEKDNMDPCDPKLEEKILKDPLMVRELVRQREDLDYLKSIPILDERTLATLRSRNNGRGNIEI